MRDRIKRECRGRQLTRSVSSAMAGTAMCHTLGGSRSSEVYRGGAKATASSCTRQSPAMPAT